MGQKLVELSGKFKTLERQRPQVNVVEIGDMAFFGVSDEQADLLKRREAFVNQFLAEKGWDASNLSIEQLLEVRGQPGWQNPPEIS